MSDNRSAPNYFVLIPSHLLDNPEISDSEAILFGRIASLSNSKGYCFASDKYLGELTGVSPGEIGKRLLKLEQHGYIKRETQKNGMYWDRKIFPNFNISNNSCEDSKRSDRTLHTEDINPSIRRTEQYKSNYNKNYNQDEVVVPPSKLDELDLRDVVKAKILKDHPEKVDNLVRRVKSWESRKDDNAAALHILQKWNEWEDEKTPEELQKLQKDILNSMKVYETAEKGSYKPDEFQFYVLSSSIELVRHNKAVEIKITEPCFLDKLDAALKSFGMKRDGDKIVMV